MMDDGGGDDENEKTNENVVYDLFSDDDSSCGACLSDVDVVSVSMA